MCSFHFAFEFWVCWNQLRLQSKELHCVLGVVPHGCLLEKSHKQLKLSAFIHTLNHVLVLALISYSELSALAIKAQTTLAYSECNIHTVQLLCTVAAAEVDAGTPSAEAHTFCAVWIVLVLLCVCLQLFSTKEVQSSSKRSFWAQPFFTARCLLTQYSNENVDDVIM